MNNILSTKFPSAKTISPVSLPEPPAPKVPSGNDLSRKLNYGIAPPHYRSISHKKNQDYCTTLSPSPRDNVDNDPACVDCNKYPNRPFKKNKCYMLYSPQQNIWGPVCGDANNDSDKWTRGNRFGVDYEYDKVFRRQDYAVDVPRFIKKNPVLVNTSPYFPIPDYNIRFNPKYKSYPYENNYIKGYPTMVFPYAPIGKNT